jgi:SAM-dependent methyltransferase
MRFIGPLYGWILPKWWVALKKTLADCDSVLDLGCGRRSALHRCNVSYSVGVDLYESALQDSGRKGIHGDYLRGDLRRLEFKPKSFDAVIAIDVLEHLTRAEGLDLLERMESWAKKKVLLITPNGYVHQEVYDNNPLQEHKSGWTASEFRELGFKVRGLNGWKGLRGEKAVVKYRPAGLWSRISDVTQRATWWFPGQAFQLLVVKTIRSGSA